jgi:hypothetical protein
MADAFGAAFSSREGRPICSSQGRRIFAMIEILFMYQLARRPLRAMARRWWCIGLYRATRGQRHCAECTKR